MRQREYYSNLLGNLGSSKRKKQAHAQRWWYEIEEIVTREGFDIA